MKHETESEKKGLFTRLKAGTKVKKSSGCCGFEVEEIPEEKDDRSDEKKPPKNKGNSYCG